MWPERMEWNEVSRWVCTTHRRFVPCRSEEDHEYSNDPTDIERVRAYQHGGIVMSDPVVNPDEPSAVTSGEQDHSDPDTVRGDDADAPADTGKPPEVGGI